MNLLLIGNISIGKTSIARALIEKGWATESSYFSIDSLRTEYSDGTYAGEFKAWAAMLEAIQDPAPEGMNGIYEFSGTGKNAWFVRSAIEYSQKKHGANWVVAYCLCEKSVILSRAKDRVYNIPIPYTFGSTESSVSYMSNELNQRFGSDYWNSPEITVRTDENNPEQAAEIIMSSL